MITDLIPNPLSLGGTLYIVLLGVLLVQLLELLAQLDLASQHCLRFLIGHHEGVVAVLPTQAFLGEFDPAGSPHVRDLEPLVVLLIRSFDHDLVLLGVYSNFEHLGRVGQVSDPPLEGVHSVLPRKYGLHVNHCTLLFDF